MTRLGHASPRHVTFSPKGICASAASAAYYATLYAARAALSERDPEISKGLARRVRRAQRLRELGDYEAQTPSRDDAEELVATAGEFVEAVGSMLAVRALVMVAAQLRETTAISSSRKTTAEPGSDASALRCAASWTTMTE